MATATAEPAKKSPRYDVYELVTVDNPRAEYVEDGATLDVLLPIGREIEATTDRNAIKEAVKGRSAEAQSGTFFAALSGSLREHTRSVTVQPVESWG